MRWSAHRSRLLSVLLLACSLIASIPRASANVPSSPLQTPPRGAVLSQKPLASPTVLVHPTRMPTPRILNGTKRPRSIPSPVGARVRGRRVAVPPRFRVHTMPRHPHFVYPSFLPMKHPVGRSVNRAFQLHKPSQTPINSRSNATRRSSHSNKTTRYTLPTKAFRPISHGRTTRFTSPAIAFRPSHHPLPRVLSGYVVSAKARVTIPPAHRQSVSLGTQKTPATTTKLRSMDMPGGSSLAGYNGASWSVGPTSGAVGAAINLIYSDPGANSVAAYFDGQGICGNGGSQLNCSPAPINGGTSDGMHTLLLVSDVRDHDVTLSVLVSNGTYIITPVQDDYTISGYNGATWSATQAQAPLGTVTQVSYDDPGAHNVAIYLNGHVQCSLDSSRVTCPISTSELTSTQPSLPPGQWGLRRCCQRLAPVPVVPKSG